MAFQVLDPEAPQAAANAYISEAEFNEWHTDRGIDLTGFAPPQIQAAIVNATDYIDKRFGRRFRGFKQTRAQRLEWPRVDSYDNDGYAYPPRPDQLIGATAEYALLALQLGRNLAPPVGPAFAVLDPKTGQATAVASGQLRRSTDVVGPIETTREFATENSRQPMGAPNLPEYPQADLWLAELLKTGRSLRRA